MQPFIPPRPSSLHPGAANTATLIHPQDLAPSAYRPQPKKGILKRSKTDAMRPCEYFPSLHDGIIPGMRPNRASTTLAYSSTHTSHNIPYVSTPHHTSRTLPHAPSGQTSDRPTFAEIVRAQEEAKKAAYLQHQQQQKAYYDQGQRHHSFSQSFNPGWPVMYQAPKQPTVPRLREQPRYSEYATAVEEPVKSEQISLVRPLTQRTIKDLNGKPTDRMEYKINIAFNPSDEDTYRLRWSYKRHMFVPIQLSELLGPASTHCSLRKMCIYCPSYTNGNPYHVYITCDTGPNGIIAIDVLEAIFRVYDQMLNEQQVGRYTSIIHSEPFKRAYEWRISHSKNPVIEAQSGPKRVDLLMGRSLFGGLRHKGGGDWELISLEHDRS